MRLLLRICPKSRLNRYAGLGKNVPV
jgi:hypothetical protein